MAGPDLQIMEIYIFVLAAIVGYHIIHRVPPLLHTPLMSATNAVSAISLVGALLIAGGTYSRGATILGTVAVAAAMTNVVGGFLITERMLKMFRSTKPRRQSQPQPQPQPQSQPQAQSQAQSQSLDRVHS
jgi:NAD(P) transhydrogenase subunit alpha